MVLKAPLVSPAGRQGSGCGAYSKCRRRRLPGNYRNKEGAIFKFTTCINGNQTDANKGTPAELANERRAPHDTSSHFPAESGLLFPNVPVLMMQHHCMACSPEVLFPHLSGCEESENILCGLRHQEGTNIGTDMGVREVFSTSQHCTAPKAGAATLTLNYNPLVQSSEKSTCTKSAFSGATSEHKRREPVAVQDPADRFSYSPGSELADVTEPL